MNISSTIELLATGTSEGAEKAWNTRGRGVKKLAKITGFTYYPKGSKAYGESKNAHVLVKEGISKNGWGMKHVISIKDDGLWKHKTSGLASGSGSIQKRGGNIDSLVKHLANLATSSKQGRILLKQRLDKYTGMVNLVKDVGTKFRVL